MKRFNELKIARQIGLTQIIVAFVIILLVVSISIYMFYNVVSTNIHSEIELSANNTVVRLEKTYEAVVEITELMKEIVVQSIDVSQVNNEEYLEEYLKQLDPFVKILAQESTIGSTAYIYFNPDLTGSVHDIYYADQDRDGTVELQNQVPLEFYQSGKSSPDKAWWFQPVITKSPYWTLPYEWTWDNGVTSEFVSYTQPVYVDGVFIGVVGADMLYDRIYKIINEGFSEEYGYVYLLNDRLQLMIHPNYNDNVSLLQVEDGYYEFLFEKMNSNYNNVFEYQRIDNVLRLGTFRNLKNGWIVGLSIDYYEAYGILTDYIMGVLGVMIVIIIIVIFVSMRIGHQITLPIKRIAGMLDDDKDALEIPLDLSGRSDEIGTLVTKLFEYKKQIQDDYIEIISKNDALLDALKKQKDLERELQIMVEVIGNSKEGIFIIDASGKTIFKNQSFIDSFGVDDNELRIFEDVLELEPYMLRQIEREKTFNAEKILKRFSGETYPAMLYVTVVDVGEKFYLGIVQDITETRAREKRIERLRFYDPLTSLMNKQRIQQIITEGIEEHYYEEGLSAMIVINLDDFRIINEAMGYDRSNKVLLKIANMLNELINKGDHLARITGDEFMIFSPNHEDIVSIQRKVEQIFQRFKLPLYIDEEELFVSVSMGISLYPLDGNNFDGLLVGASSALNHVKNSFKNSYAFYNLDVNEETKETYDLMRFLRKALDINAYRLVYQPQYDIEKNEIVGYEALLRLEYEGKPISPVKFIPLLEKGNLITLVGEWVIEESMAFAKELERIGHAAPISVNISGIQFKRPYLIEMTEKMLKKHEIAPEMIKYEITEGILLNDIEEAQSVIEALHDIGIKVAIDDFGTGYSSLAYLKKFNIDCLKIDRAFIMEYPSKDDGYIAKAIISLAESLNLEIIAEGVETDEQAKFLKDNHCLTAQGFLYSRPLKQGDIIELIK